MQVHELIELLSDADADADVVLMDREGNYLHIADVGLPLRAVDGRQGREREWEVPTMIAANKHFDVRFDNVSD